MVVLLFSRHFHRDEQGRIPLRYVYHERVARVMCGGVPRKLVHGAPVALQTVGRCFPADFSCRRDPSDGFLVLCSCPKPLNDWRNSVPQEPPCRSQWRAFGLYAEWQSPSSERAVWPGSATQEWCLAPLSRHSGCRTYIPCRAACTSGASRRDMRSRILFGRPIGSGRLSRAIAQCSAIGSSCSRTT